MRLRRPLGVVTALGGLGVFLGFVAFGDHSHLGRAVQLAGCLVVVVGSMPVVLLNMRNRWRRWSAAFAAHGLPDGFDPQTAPIERAPFLPRLLRFAGSRVAAGAASLLRTVPPDPRDGSPARIEEKSGDGGN